MSVNTPDDGTPITEKELPSQTYKTYFDEIGRVIGSSLGINSYTVTTLPSATEIGIIFVSDETGGAVMAFSDGTNFRRCTDRAIVS